MYDHFSRWRKAGVFAAVVEALQVKLDKRGLIDWDLWCVDGAKPPRTAPGEGAGAGGAVGGVDETGTAPAGGMEGEEVVDL